MNARRLFMNSQPTAALKGHDGATLGCVNDRLGPSSATLTPPS